MCLFCRLLNFWSEVLVTMSKCSFSCYFGYPKPEMGWENIVDLLTIFQAKSMSRIRFSKNHLMALTIYSLPAETAPPNFIQRLQSMTVRQGSQVRLDVRVTGIPTPVVKFYREGAEIQSSQIVQIVQDGDLYSLLIAEAFPEDYSVSSVSASNSSGRTTSTAELLVQGEEVAVPAKKTKTFVSTSQISQTRQARVEKRMEASFESTAMMEMQIEDGDLAHKAPPRVPPKPTTKSPTPPGGVSKVAATRHQSPSPVRPVKAPIHTPHR
uniref:Immunoglobulin I-set domain-containing protein n=1 Tax=Sinocyclocheilus anshuiensis TaxID=1608454 RepID=A0A671K3K2_9TELE